MSPFIVQGIGYLAVACVIYSFQQRRRVSILIAMLVGVSLFAVHYSLLGAWTGAILNLIEASVIYVAYKKETSSWANRLFWPYLFSLAYLIAGVLTADHLYSYMPVVAQIVGVIAVWQRKPRNIRFIMLIPRPLWLTYNFLVGSQAGMVAEVFVLASLIIGIIRFDILKQKSANS